MPLWIWVALGSALGGVARYAVAKTWPSVPGGWPIATMSVNVIGSLAIGVCSVLLAARVTSGGSAISFEAMQLFWMTGVLGGFTTYSAFALETVLVSGASPWRAGAYVVATVTLCVSAAWVGRALASS
jgi:CrcB protein